MSSTTPASGEQSAWYRRGAELLWESQGDGSAVFDPDTGETHFLSDLPAMALAEIGDTPVTLSGLIARLDAPEDLPAEARQQIHAALLSLEQVELITSETLDTD